MTKTTVWILTLPVLVLEEIVLPELISTVVAFYSFIVVATKPAPMITNARIRIANPIQKGDSTQIHGQETTSVSFKITKNTPMMNVKL